MVKNKTQPTDQAVVKFLDTISNEEQKNDAFELLKIMQATTGEPATMWGSSIIGFGSYHYKYESGREGDSLRVGFAPRKTNLVLYGLATQNLEHPNSQLLKQFGKYTTGKGCIYIKRLKDVDLAVLKNMIKNSFSH